MNADKLKTLLIPPDLSIKKAMQQLDETAEKILFVVSDARKLLGTVTDGDIRRGLINGLKFDAPVEDVMHVDFTFIPLSKIEDKAGIERLMVDNKYEQVPALDHQGAIRDVILWTDILGEKSQSGAPGPLPNQVVIMAGGMGTRLDPFTKILPKPLIPIGNKPIIEIIMERFSRGGFHKFIYTLNYKKEYLKLFFKESNFPYDISWVEEDAYMGTAGGLALVKDRISGTFIVTNCDSLLEIDFDKVLKWHKEQEAAITVIGCHREVKIPFGVLELSNGRLEHIVEKPVHDVIINTGIYIMEPSVISLIRENEKTDMDWLLAEAAKVYKVGVYPIYSGWFDIGQWEEYQRSIEKMRGQ